MSIRFRILRTLPPALHRVETPSPSLRHNRQALPNDGGKRPEAKEWRQRNENEKTHPKKTIPLPHSFASIPLPQIPLPIFPCRNRRLIFPPGPGTRSPTQTTSPPCLIAVPKRTETELNADLKTTTP